MTRETMPGLDEEFRPANFGAHPPGLQSNGFQRTGCRRSHRHHPSAQFAGAFDVFGLYRLQLITFSAHAMLLNGLVSHRLKGSPAHVKRKHRLLNAMTLQVRQKLRREMQASGRRRHRSRAARVYRLIAFQIEFPTLHPLLPFDIGRQRNLPQLGKHRQNIGRRKVQDGGSMFQPFPDATP